MVSLSGPGPMMDEIEKTNKSSPSVDKHPFNWWYKDEKKMPDKTIEPPKLKIPDPRSESADVTPIMESQERRGSVTLVDAQPPQMNQQRRDSDIDRLYRLSNLIHACGSRDD